MRKKNKYSKPQPKRDRLYLDKRSLRALNRYRPLSDSLEDLRKKAQLEPAADPTAGPSDWIGLAETTIHSVKLFRD